MSARSKFLWNHVTEIPKKYFREHLDQHQFAYRSERGVEDAIVLFTHNIYKRVMNVRTTFMIDFSSATPIDYQIM